MYHKMFFCPPALLKTYNNSVFIFLYVPPYSPPLAISKSRSKLPVVIAAQPLMNPRKTHNILFILFKLNIFVQNTAMPHLTR